MDHFSAILGSFFNLRQIPEVHKAFKKPHSSNRQGWVSSSLPFQYNPQSDKYLISIELVATSSFIIWTLGDQKIEISVLTNDYLLEVTLFPKILIYIDVFILAHLQGRIIILESANSSLILHLDLILHIIYKCMYKLYASGFWIIQRGEITAYEIFVSTTTNWP